MHNKKIFIFMFIYSSWQLNFIFSGTVYCFLNLVISFSLKGVIYDVIKVL